MKLNKTKKYESNKPTTKAFEAYVTASKNADMSKCHDASNPAPQCLSASHPRVRSCVDHCSATKEVKQ